MNEKQLHFNNLFDLLKKTINQSEFVSECLAFEKSELTFNSFNGNIKVGKDHIYSVYKTRFRIEKDLRPDNYFVLGYKELLPNLKKSELQFINVTSLNTDLASYLIFSDYEYSQLIGILKSKRNIMEIREKMNGSEYYQENTFKNGELVEL